MKSENIYLVRSLLNGKGAESVACFDYATTVRDLVFNNDDQRVRVDASLEEFALESRIEEVPQLVVKHVRNERGRVVERLLSDIEELEYIDTILAISGHATKDTTYSLAEVLSAVSNACPDAGYPEWTAVWMLCEELGLNITPTQIIKELEGCRLVGTRLQRRSFYNYQFPRSESNYYPNWVLTYGTPHTVFQRMKKAASVAYTMLKTMRS